MCVKQMWDWDVCASWDDGETWAGWNSTEKSPGQCGEGGGGMGLGASGNAIMFHRNSFWQSSDGGHNFQIGTLPGTAGSFDYARKTGSRTEPEGKIFAIMDAPPSANFIKGSKALGDDSDGDGALFYSPLIDNGEDADGDGEDESNRDSANAVATVKFLMTSLDFGKNWTWAPLPSNLQATGLAVDPTASNSVFAFTSSCLSHSIDDGKTWSTCSNAKGLVGSFSKLIIKSSTTMFMLRSGEVPLRTTGQSNGDTRQGPRSPFAPNSQLPTHYNLKLTIRLGIIVGGAKGGCATL